MDVSEENPNNKDLFKFARETKEKFTSLMVNSTVFEIDNFFFTAGSIRFYLTVNRLAGTCNN